MWNLSGSTRHSAMCVVKHMVQEVIDAYNGMVPPRILNFLPACLPKKV
jgi:hypothetical protein